MFIQVCLEYRLREKFGWVLKVLGQVTKKNDQESLNTFAILHINIQIELAQ